jgi:hypothetical protein
MSKVMFAIQAGLHKDNEALCQDVYDGIDSDNDIDSIEKLFVSGDGAHG